MAKQQPKPPPSKSVNLDDLSHIKAISDTLVSLANMLNKYEDSMNKASSPERKETFNDMWIEQADALNKKVKVLDEEIQKL